MKKIIVGICVSVLLTTLGCQRRQALIAEDSNAITKVKAVSIPKSIVPAVERVGGLKSWNDTQMIAGSCALTAYRPDGRQYLTTQKHAVFPWSHTIRVWASEPEGEFLWSLFREKFHVLSGPKIRPERMLEIVGDQYIIEAIWSILAAPARIAGLAEPNTEPGEAVLLEGLWYRPIPVEGGRVYYLNEANGIIDVCLIPAKDGKYYLARGYEFRPRAQTMISLPEKIEIFESNKAAAALRRVAQVNYSQLSTEAF